MKDRVLITGANGMVAKKLGTHMQSQGFDVIFLSTKKNNKASNVYFWNPENKEIDIESIKNVTHYSFSRIQYFKCMDKKE